MLTSRFARAGFGAALLAALATTPACSANDDASSGDESDLTSVTARSRSLEFAGTVYVSPASSDTMILSAVRSQTQTAFGPLLHTDMAAYSRELREVDPATFVKRPVKVVAADGSTREMLEVKYVYKDTAVVGQSLARRSSIPLALMSPGYKAQTERILRECTANDDDAREFASSIWYVFNPNEPSCQEAIAAEQAVVDAARRKLGDHETEIAAAEVERLYLPITVKLGADKTNRGNSYPEYDRLFRGGVKQDKLVVSLVFGLIDHDKNADPSADYNWGELMTALDLVMSAQGEAKDWTISTDGDNHVDLGKFELPSGKVVEAPSVLDLAKLRRGGEGSALQDLGYEDRRDLMQAFALRMNKAWLAVERPIRVAIGDEAPRDFAIQLQVYFGAESDSAPHRHATRNSDVFVYNGHSSIGYGPLDPRNFRPEDFAKSYQLMWVDGCVSYNYYNKDYLPLKEGGSKNLDLVVNGLEAPAYRGGYANGRFLVKLLDGNGTSYRDLLLAAKDTEALRVVDGELDNEYQPARAPVAISPR